MSASDTLRTLTIKTGVVQRTLKELVSYQIELEENRNMVEQVRASRDHSKLKQWENVVAETQGMIPDTKSRLSNAVDDLNSFMENTSAERSLEGSSQLELAKTVLASAAKLLDD